MLAKLWGGAITCTLPDGVVDVSKLRQVPDNQEAFLVEGTSVKEDRAVIIELLEKPRGTIQECLKTHLSDLLDESVEHVDKVLSRDGTGELPFEKYSNKIGDDNYLVVYKDDTDDCLIVFTLVSLAKVNGDILISLLINSGNRHYQSVKGVKLSDVINDKVGIKNDWALVEGIGKTINVEDWNLFA